MGGCVGGWVSQWVNGCGQVKSLDNSILFEDLWYVETPLQMAGWMGGSVGQWVGLGQGTKNLINLDLIEIIQFCLKIYDI